MPMGQMGMTETEKIMNSIHTSTDKKHHWHLSVLETVELHSGQWF